MTASGNASPSGSGFSERQERYWRRRQRRRDPHHPAVEGFAQPKVEMIRRWLSDGSPPLILEAGSGDGYLTHYLRRLGRVVALDYSLQMLQENSCEMRTVGDAACLPFRDGAFPVVVEANLLHHVPDPLAVVREMRRATRDLVVLIEPNRLNPLMLALGLAKREERRTLRMCRPYLKRLLECAGLELFAMVTQGFVTPNRMPTWLVNCLRRLERPSRVAGYIVAAGRRID